MLVCYPGAVVEAMDDQWAILAALGWNHGEITVPPALSKSFDYEHDVRILRLKSTAPIDINNAKFAGDLGVSLHGQYYNAPAALLAINK
jgi:hypothetical protein